MISFYLNNILEENSKLNANFFTEITMSFYIINNTWVIQLSMQQHVKKKEIDVCYIEKKKNIFIVNFIPSLVLTSFF